MPRGGLRPLPAQCRLWPIWPTLRHRFRITDIRVPRSTQSLHIPDIATASIGDSKFRHHPDIICGNAWRPL